MKNRIAIALAIALACIAITPTSHAATSDNPYGASTVDPAGPNEIIFTVAKGKKVQSFTIGRLNKFKTSTISIYEPFVKKRQTFTVIPIKTFFTLVGITANDKVSTIALNDYVYNSTAKKFLDANTYVAIKRNGLDIPYDQGGPLRLVYADNSSWANSLDSWNWSLEKIVVK